MAVLTPLHTHMCSELVSVEALGQGPAAVVPGNLEEIGEWNALVLTEAPLPRGAKVRVTCGSYQLKGIVESCRRDDVLGYFVELRLSPESRWSEDWFAPQHLLALSKFQPQVFDLVLASGY